jgi:anti-anti-sigma factor
LDPDTSEPFRRTCWEKLIGEKVVFDMRNLSFVGSLGLQSFVDTLDHMAKNSGVRLCGVSSEFRRLFEASGMADMRFYESREQALESFSAPSA